MKLSLVARISPLLVLGLGLGLGCSRHLELYEPAEAGVPVLEGPKAPEEIPEVPDSGVAGGELVTCAERRTGDCLGANDFPCDFQGWVHQRADTCKAALDCRVKGWLGVALGADGCVEAIDMTDVNSEFVACLVEEFAHFGCVHCDAQYETHYLGTSAEPCAAQ